jgi:hypothetical protein
VEPQTKGQSLRSYLSAVESAVGKAKLGEIVAALPPEIGTAIREGSILSPR